MGHIIFPWLKWCATHLTFSNITVRNLRPKYEGCEIELFGFTCHSSAFIADLIAHCDVTSFSKQPVLPWSSLDGETSSCAWLTTFLMIPIFPWKPHLSSVYFVKQLSDTLWHHPSYLCNVVSMLTMLRIIGGKTQRNRNIDSPWSFAVLSKFPSLEMLVAWTRWSISPHVRDGIK